MGGSGEAGGIVDFTVAVNPATGVIDVVATFGPPNGGAAGGLELQTNWDSATTTQPAPSWTQPDNAGPWRVSIYQGEILTPDMLTSAPSVQPPDLTALTGRVGALESTFQRIKGDI
jgi:hypothetical protein